jgi:hypothetical protein
MRYEYKLKQNRAPKSGRYEGYLIRIQDQSAERFIKKLKASKKVSREKGY